jgi:hypothetical protein
VSKDVENYETNPTSMDRRFQDLRSQIVEGSAVIDRRYRSDGIFYETNPFCSHSTKDVGTITRTRICDDFTKRTHAPGAPVQGFGFKGSKFGISEIRAIRG